jgi:hypothetical protein
MINSILPHHLGMSNLRFCLDDDRELAVLGLEKLRQTDNVALLLSKVIVLVNFVLDQLFKAGKCTLHAVLALIGPVAVLCDSALARRALRSMSQRVQWWTSFGDSGLSDSGLGYGRLSDWLEDIFGWHVAGCEGDVLVNQRVGFGGA